MQRGSKNNVCRHNCTTNDAVIKDIKKSLPPRSLVLDGQFLHIRCTAHIINLIVQEAVKHTNDVTSKIIKSVRYVRSSTIRQTRLTELAIQIGAPKSKLVLVS